MPKKQEQGKPRASQGKGHWHIFAEKNMMVCFLVLSFQPPKKSYVNYKVLQEQIKEKKAAKEEEKRLVGVMVCPLFS